MIITMMVVEWLVDAHMLMPHHADKDLDAAWLPGVLFARFSLFDPSTTATTTTAIILYSMHL